MTIALAESLLESDGFDGADMALRFARGYQIDPFRGYGASVVEVFVCQGARRARRRWSTAA
ncbi:hypothetical protein BH23ACT5_BH23ACT5_21750 [soil metagenome]